MLCLNYYLWISFQNLKLTICFFSLQMLEHVRRRFNSIAICSLSNFTSSCCHFALLFTLFLRSNTTFFWWCWKPHFHSPSTGNFPSFKMNILENKNKVTRPNSINVPFILRNQVKIYIQTMFQCPLFRSLERRISYLTRSQQRTDKVCCFQGCHQLIKMSLSDNISCRCSHSSHRLT